MNFILKLFGKASGSNRNNNDDDDNNNNVDEPQQSPSSRTSPPASTQISVPDTPDMQRQSLVVGINLVPGRSKEEDNKRLAEKFERILRKGNVDNPSIEAWLQEIRELILFSGLPEETEEERRAIIEGTGCSLRGRVWKALLRVKYVNADYYLELVRSGPTAQYDIIIKDVERLFQADKEFIARVPQSKSRRVLNSFVLSCGGLEKSQFSYYQGMNGVCAPFLFTMSEVDAYFSFRKLVTHICPTYVHPELLGAKAGCKLVDIILEIVDPELYKHMLDRMLTAKVYGLESIQSFCTQTTKLVNDTRLPSITEVVRLYDFFVAFGFHLSVLCLVSQVLLLREEILRKNSGVAHKDMSEILLFFRPVRETNAVFLMTMIMQLAKKLPPILYDFLVTHLFDLTTCEMLLSGAINTQMILSGREDNDSLATTTSTNVMDSTPVSSRISVSFNYQ